MKRLLAIFALAVLFTVPLAGCTSSPAAPPTTATVAPARTVIPVDRNLDYLSTASYGAPDDLVFTPGGLSYRGNVNGVDPVPMDHIEKNGITFSWRASATIAPGETKYNGVGMFTAANFTEGHLYAEHLPDWLALVSSQAFPGPGFAWDPVVAMEAGVDAPLQHIVTFDLGMELDGVDYGPFPVTLWVIATPDEPSPPYGTLVPYGVPVVSSNGTEYPDDLVFTPGGSAYRGNVNPGPGNPWPFVRTSLVHLASGNITALVQYRADITTNAGQVRNDIITASGNRLVNGDVALDLYSFDVPAGFILTRSGGAGLPGQILALLQIKVATDVPPGDYTFSLAVAPGDIYLGKVPVTVHIVTQPVNTPMATP